MFTRLIFSQGVTDPENAMSIDPLGATQSAKFMQAAKALETRFVTEMLKSAKVGEVSGPFDQGVGADQFSSFLRDTYAEQVVEKGGFGLAQSLFHALAKDQK